jgi:hypothetical protein
VKSSFNSNKPVDNRDVIEFDDTDGPTDVVRNLPVVGRLEDLGASR